MDLLGDLLKWFETGFSEIQMDISEIQMDFSESENP